ncbi:hypothetical protein RvY_07436-4 [Ramazzottius varieornatus]|uniref:Uncharacterized protein n=1 Tax=Ramazzottius varieornatus TaxID=947166 RepID=A0A1D1V5A3_RAMVA|nr:hypothetical protein RvY_07436-4 [Ramazzottius varieornatus]
MDVAPSVTAAFFSAMVAISYVFSMLFLNQSHLILKSVFVIVSCVGVALVGYATTKDPLDPCQRLHRSDGCAWVLLLPLSSSGSLHQIFSQCRLEPSSLYRYRFLHRWRFFFPTGLCDSY